MRKPAAILMFIGFIMLLLGWAAGTFFTERRVTKVIAQTPGSPIILNANYNREKHSIFYSVLNPGGTPITIVEKSFVFTPGSESKEKRYVVSHIPVHVVLPPGVTTQVELKLKAGTEKLHIKDAILATFTYTHPLSKDLYSVIHPFTMGVKKKNKKETKTAKEESK